MWRREVDDDASGTIDPTELKLALGRLGVAQNLSQSELAAIVAMADTDGDGNVEYREFIAMVESKTKEQSCDNPVFPSTTIEASLDPGRLPLGISDEAQSNTTANPAEALPGESCPPQKFSDPSFLKGPHELDIAPETVSWVTEAPGVSAELEEKGQASQEAPSALRTEATIDSDEVGKSKVDKRSTEVVDEVSSPQKCESWVTEAPGACAELEEKGQASQEAPSALGTEATIDSNEVGKSMVDERSIKVVDEVSSPQESESWVTEAPGAWAELEEKVQAAVEHVPLQALSTGAKTESADVGNSQVHIGGIGRLSDILSPQGHNIPNNVQPCVETERTPPVGPTRINRHIFSAPPVLGPGLAQKASEQPPPSSFGALMRSLGHANLADRLEGALGNNEGGDGDLHENERTSSPMESPPPMMGKINNGRFTPVSPQPASPGDQTRGSPTPLRTTLPSDMSKCVVEPTVIGHPEITTETSLSESSTYFSSGGQNAASAAASFAPFLTSLAENNPLRASLSSDRIEGGPRDEPLSPLSDARSRLSYPLAGAPRPGFGDSRDIFITRATNSAAVPEGAALPLHPNLARSARLRNSQDSLESCRATNSPLVKGAVWTGKAWAQPVRPPLPPPPSSNSEYCEYAWTYLCSL